MPLISSSWSTEERPPFWSRNSMIFSAVTGPIPSISSSWSTVALPSEIGPSAAAPATAAAAARHDDLLAVAEPRGQVDAVLGRAPGETAGALDRVGDPRAERQPVDARLGDRARDVDDDVAGGVGGGLEAVGLEAERAAALGRGGLLARAHPAGADQQHGDRDRGVDEQLRSAELGHRARLARARSRGARGMRQGARGPRAELSGSGTPSSPSGSSSVTSSSVTSARPGPRGRTRPSPRPPPRSPSKTASTAPSSRLVTQPATPSASARRRTVSRKKTPCTRPRATTRRLVSSPRRRTPRRRPAWERRPRRR